jgi:hypothetical protein
MAHAKEDTERFVCENCQITHAGTPIHNEETGNHSFEAPTRCGGCGESSFVSLTEWIHHHK